VNTSMTTMDSPARLLRYNRSLPARTETAWGCRTITPLRSADYLYVRACLVPELVAELFAEAEGEQS
jgi:hypothetical protein